MFVLDPSSCQLIVDEELQKSAVYDADSQIYEHNKLQVDSGLWRVEHPNIS